VPNYLIRKRLIALGDDFWVEDENGERVFHVDGKVLRPRETFVIETADGDELVRVQERKLHLRDTMVIERQGEELATVQKALITPLRDRFEIELAGGGRLEAKGDLLDHEFTIEWENGVRLAEVSKKRFAIREAYGVSVPDDQDPVFAVAVAICIGAMERG
jgi:uncharacterized protein YxjI